MRVQSVTVDEYNDNVEFQAVYGGTTNAEDNTYASATPSGSMKLCVNNVRCGVGSSWEVVTWTSREVPEVSEVRMA